MWIFVVVVIVSHLDLFINDHPFDNWSTNHHHSSYFHNYSCSHCQNHYHSFFLLHWDLMCVCLLNEFFFKWMRICCCCCCCLQQIRMNKIYNFMIIGICTFYWIKFFFFFFCKKNLPHSSPRSICQRRKNETKQTSTWCIG